MIDNDIPSKTQRKKQALALQAFVKELINLPASQYNTLPIDPTLNEAIQTAKRLRQPSAIKRQIQYIAKRLQQDEYEALSTVLKAQPSVTKTTLNNDKQTQANRIREQLLHDGNALSQFINQHNNCDTQVLRQHLRLAKAALNTQEINGANQKHFDQLLVCIQRILDQQS